MPIIAVTAQPIFLVSFVLFAIQYYIMWTSNWASEPRFWLMVATLVLMVGTAILSPSLFLVLPLALFWFGLSVYLYRHMPPSNRPKRRTTRRN